MNGTIIVAIITVRAANTLVALQTNSGLRARFGDPQKLPAVAHELTSLHTRVGAYVESVVALAKDATRTEVAKHAAAKELAQRTIKAIGNTAEALKTRAAILQSDGQSEADHFFAPQPGYSHIESEIRTWVREQVKSETGLGKVLSLAKEDRTLASVIYHSPHYLTGLAPDLQAKLRLDMTEHFIPEAFALVTLATRSERSLKSVIRFLASQTRASASLSTLRAIYQR